MNILVIFTGGTICSSINNGYINTNETGGDRLINEYKKLHAQDTENINFMTAQPYYILSENLNGGHINKLADCIHNAIHASSPDGIIITHGTDTQQYMSSALSYMYPNLQIPVVLVSSNYILDDERANGIENLSAAVDFIKGCSNNQQMTHHGVYTAYKNENEAAVIHYGTRLLPHMPYSDKLYSLDNLVCDRDSSLLYDKQYNSPTDAYKTEPAEHTLDKQYNSSFDAHNTTITESKSVSQIDIYKYLNGRPRFTETSPVLYIRPIPGQQYSNAPDYVQAILLDSFHSGTLCTDDEGFQSMLSDATKRKIPIFLTGAENRTGYESTRIYKDLSISVLPKASPISMYMKLWLLLSVNCENIYDCMSTPVCHDII